METFTKLAINEKPKLFKDLFSEKIKEKMISAISTRKKEVLKNFAKFESKEDGKYEEEEGLEEAPQAGKKIPASVLRQRERAKKKNLSDPKIKAKNRERRRFNKSSAGKVAKSKRDRLNIGAKKKTARRAAQKAGK